MSAAGRPWSNSRTAGIPRASGPTLLVEAGPPAGGQRAGWTLRAKVLGRWWDRTSALPTRLARRLCFGTVVGPISMRRGGPDARGFPDGQRAPQEAGVQGFLQLAPQAAS